MSTCILDTSSKAKGSCSWVLGGAIDPQFRNGQCREDNMTAFSKSARMVEPKGKAVGQSGFAVEMLTAFARHGPEASSGRCMTRSWRT